jgi:hypothetical protein
MAERTTVTIALTKEQQLDLLAATGLLVKSLEVDAEALDEGGAASAQVPLPKWLAPAEVAP